MEYGKCRLNYCNKYERYVTDKCLYCGRSYWNAKIEHKIYLYHHCNIPIKNKYSNVNIL